MILALVLTTLACAVQPARAPPGPGADRPGGDPGPWAPCRSTRRCSWRSSPRRRGWRWLNGLVIGRIGQGVVRDLRHRLYERLQQVGLAYYDRTPSGAIIARVMDDVGAIQVFVTGQTFTILTDLGTTLAIAALLLWRGLAAGGRGAAASPRCSRSTSATSWGRSAPRTPSSARRWI